MTNELKRAHLDESRRIAARGGGEKRLAAQHAKGKLSARERLAGLLDPGSFQELEMFTQHRCTSFDMDAEHFPGDSVVTGLGRVNGRAVSVFSQDFTVFGGSLSEVAADKICKVMDLAMRNGTPIVGLNDSGGARIQEGVLSLDGYARMFTRHTLASGVVPQISVQLGPTAGGSVYSPGLTDFVIMVDQTSHMFITGPEVIKQITGEVVTFEDLGGARVHNAVSGVAHFFARDENEALSITKRLLSFLPANNTEDPPARTPTDPAGRMDTGLDTIIPEDRQAPYDMKEVIHRVVDDGDFLEVHASFAQNILVGFARLNGRVVGLVAQQPAFMGGVLDVNASDKAARFVRVCDAFNTPIVTLVDSPGFLPGVGQEHGGIIRHGAKLVYAYCEATVPKIALVTRKAYGGAYIVMSSKFTRCDLNLAWPTAEIAVLGAEAAANILYSKVIAAATDPAAERARVISEFEEKFYTPYEAARLGRIDDVIQPRETRPRLIAALEFLRTKRDTLPAKKHGNIPL
jgi:acetyl-CoA carboxylase carboxyltransferase component